MPTWRVTPRTMAPVASSGVGPLAGWRGADGTKKGKGENAPPEPWLYYVAVDDGRDDRTTAWALPVALRRDVVTGSTVSLTVRPWSRRVLTMSATDGTVADPISSAVIP